MGELSDRLTAALADRYTIEREIGSGGMAIVYLARDLKHNRLVAIKVLRPELAAALGAERFLREIETSAGLNHPHILTLIDSGQHDDFLYYVMPYVEGESLRRRLDRETQLPVDESLLIAREVADALGYAHRQGVVHRDIKPENILLSEGHAVIMDFGIAEAIAEAGGERLTGTGLVVGSPAYMSPEQASGERSLDARSDIYALGCVLYEMLAGDTPHTGDTAREVLARRLTEEPQPIDERRSDFPQPLADVVHRSLSTEPAGRYESAEAMQAALSSAATEVTTASGGAGADDRPSRGSMIGGAVLITAIIAIIVLMLLDSKGRDPGVDEVSSDPSTRALAVLPFDVRSEGLDVWREGMVDVLSTNLTGATGLRAISSRTVLARWREAVGDGEAVDLETALAVARNADADYALLGHVIASGSNLRLSVDIYDVSSGDLVETVQAEGFPDSVFALVDGLSVDVLGTLASDPDIDQPRVNLAGTTTSSLDALKYFLAGESRFRRSDFARAIEEYENAIAVDSLFALAHLRLSIAYGWQEGVFSGRARAEQDIAGALADRLPPREQLLVKTRFDFRAGALDGLDALRELARTNPDDAEAWYLLGEMYIHAGENIPVSWPEIEEVFARAVALEPDFAPYHEHLIHVAMRSGDSAFVRTAIEGLERAKGAPAVSERAAFDLAFGDSAVRAAATAGLDTITADVMIDLIVSLSHPRYWSLSETVLLSAYPRSDELSITGMSPAAFRGLGVGFLVRGSGLGAGRMQSALEYLDYPESAPDQRACETYTMFATGLPVPEPVLESMVAGAPETPGPWLLCTGGFAADQGRWSDHADAVAGLDDAASAALAGGDSASWRFLAANARVLGAYGLLSRGDAEGAIPLLKANYIDASPPVSRSRLARWWLAEAYLEADRPEDAVPFLRSFWISPVGVAWYRLGQTFEALGEDEEAIAAYEEFVAAWSEADPEVQHMVEDARTRIDALAATRE